MAYNHTEYMRQYLTDPARRGKHLAIVRRRDRERRAEVRAVIDTFRTNGCALCSETAACCLHAHHRDPAAKDFNVANAARRKISPKRVEVELAKCVCVCANCHSKIHAGLIQLS